MVQNTALTEHEALTRLAKSDHRFRFVAYTTMLVLFGFFALVIWQAQSQRSQEVDTTLTEIRRLYNEMAIVNRESNHYNTCIFVVPIEQRTPAQQRRCFHEADLPGGLNEKDFVTVPPDRPPASARGTSSSSPATFYRSSSSNHTPSRTPAQSNNPQSQGSSGTTQPPSGGTPEPQPREVLGIPLCLPFTNACIM